MSFHEDLTDIEIENFVNEIDKTVQEENFDTAFQKAIDKIHEYPTCENLIYSVVIYLEGALALYNVSEIERYREVFETFYKRLVTSEIPEIKDAAIRMLISYTRNRGEFLKAEELINLLPFSTVDKEEQFAILYQCQERYKDAKKIWERRVLNSVTETQTALMNMLEIALVENRDSEAEFFADMYEAIARQFCFPDWICYNAHLRLAVEKKDKDESLSILQKMLPAMKKEWNPQDYALYRNAEVKGATFFSRLVETICAELVNNEEFAFLRDGSELKPKTGSAHIPYVYGR